MLSITASLFCINVMFSYAEDLYLSSYDASWYSTICISNIDYDKYAEISEYIEKIRITVLEAHYCFLKQTMQ